MNWLKQTDQVRAGLTRATLACLVTGALLGNTPLLAQQPSSPDKQTDGLAPPPISVQMPRAGETETTATPVALGDLIEQALEHNPEIKAMQRRFDMMRARIPQAKALPDPTLSLGYMGNIVPIPPFDVQKGDPSSGRMIGFSQEFPFPGKRSLRGKVAHSDADAEWWAFEQTRRNVVAEVKDAYFDLAYITRAIAVVGKTQSLLLQFTKIAEARYAVGKGAQQDVLKAQVELSRLTEQEALLEQRRQIAEARLNSLLYREPEAPVAAPVELQSRDFPYTLTDLNEAAIANYPELKGQRRRIERDQYAIQLAKKDLYPDFSVGFTYVNRPAMPEMFGLQVGIKLPLYYWQKQRPAVTEAVASADAGKRSLENMTTMLLFKIRDRYLAETTAKRLVSLYGTTIIPQSSLSLESAIAGYEVGKVDFLTLLDNLVTLLNYELSYYEQLSNEERAVAALEPLLGVTLRP
jgi:outer membrane protein, heavy metal efflux system